MKFLLSLVLLSAAFAGGWFANQHLGSSMHHARMDATPTDAEKQPLYWVAPMDPNYRRDKPGKSPMGMDLVPVYEEDGGSAKDGGVTISATTELNLGVRTAKVIQGEFALPINTAGSIGFNEDQLVHVHSRVEGWIETAYVKSVGENVERGQKLFELYSPQLVNAQEEFLAALRSNNQILLKASKTRLLSLGFTNAQAERLKREQKVSQLVTHYAERSGVVASFNAREGMFIRPSMELMTIGSLQEVWLIAEVFERQAGWIAENQDAEIRVLAIPGKTFEGKVDYIYPVLDTTSRTLQVRIRIPNSGLELKPNMYADVQLLSALGSDVMSIPSEAVIRTGQHNRVVIAEGNGRYRPAFVSLGVESADRVQILSGLETGQEVVTSAQFLIDSESKIDVALAAFEAEQKLQEQPQEVIAQGKLEEVKQDLGLLSITHDPIPEWDWPTMKMDFKVSSEVKTEDLKPGSKVEFTLVKEGDWEYRILSLTKMEKEMEMGMEMDHSAHHAMDSEDSGMAMMSMGGGVPKEGAKVRTQGEIKNVMMGTNMVSILHDPIPDWDWPVMNMMFTVSESENFEALSTGQRIEFDITNAGGGDYVVDNIRQLP